MGKQVSPEEAGDIDTSKDSLLSADKLKVYIDEAPADDRTTTIQDSFIKLPVAPDISNEAELFAFRDSVKNLLKIKTFGAFPAEKSQFNQFLEFRTLDGGSFGEAI